MKFVDNIKIEEGLKNYYLKNSQYSNAPTVALELYSKNDYSTSINTIEKRSLLSHEEFLNAIAYSQLNLETMMQIALPDDERKKITTDSLLIPSNLDCKAIKILPYNEVSFHSHSCFDIYYVYSGHGILDFENSKKDLNEGDICIVSPNSSHMIEVEPDSIIIDIYIRKSTFDKIFFNVLTEYGTISTFLRSVIYNQKNSNYLLFKSQARENPDELIKNIFVETNYIDDFSNSSCIHYINLLFISILRHFNYDDCYFEFKDNHDATLYQIIEYIQNNYQTVTMESLAKVFGYNQSYLSSVFTKQLNMHFTDLLTNFRMLHAKEYLLHTDKSIADISELLGYTSVDHFSRTFKKRESLPPLAYRKKYRKE